MSVLQHLKEERGHFIYKHILLSSLAVITDKKCCNVISSTKQPYVQSVVDVLEIVNNITVYLSV